MIMNLTTNIVKRLASLAVGTAVAISGAACSATPKDDSLTIVTSAYPFAFAAERVAGAHAEVTNLLAAGGDAHDIELAPRQIESIATADLVVFQTGFQKVVDEAVEQQKPAHTLDTATFLEMHEADHDHGIYDPHTWLDPMNVAQIATHIADTLSEIDPDNAGEYRANAEALGNELTTLDSEFATGLASCRIETFIVNHEAFGYLADRYALHQVGIVGLSTEEEPSPARIANVQQIATQYGVTTIFYEHAVSPKVAETIANDLGLITDVLDPVATLSDSSRGSDYLEVMRSNLASLKTANNCP